MTPSELRQWRHAEKLTYDQAAALFGVPRRTYAYWEQGGDPRPGRERFTEVPQLAALAWCEVRRRLKKNRDRSQKGD